MIDFLAMHTVNRELSEPASMPAGRYTCVAVGPRAILHSRDCLAVDDSRQRLSNGPQAQLLPALCLCGTPFFPSLPAFVPEPVLVKQRFFTRKLSYRFGLLTLAPPPSPCCSRWPEASEVALPVALRNHCC